MPYLSISSSSILSCSISAADICGATLVRASALVLRLPPPAPAPPDGAAVIARDVLEGRRLAGCGTGGGGTFAVLRCAGGG